MKYSTLLLLACTILACTTEENAQPAGPSNQCDSQMYQLGESFTPELNFGAAGTPPDPASRRDVTATFVQRTDDVAEWSDVEGAVDLPTLRVPDGVLTAGSVYRIRHVRQFGSAGGTEHLFAVHDADARLVLLALSGSKSFVQSEIASLGIQSEWQPFCTSQPSTCYESEAHAVLSWAGTAVAPGVPTTVDSGGQSLTVLLEAAVEGEGDPACADVPLSFAWLTILPGE